MMDYDRSIKSLSCREFLKFKLGQYNTREIIQNYFKTVKYTLSENRHFVLKIISIKLVINQKNNGEIN